MKLRILSDLHLEGYQPQISQGDEDVVVLAGDVHTRNRAPEWARSVAFPDRKIIYVPGNHEFYNGDFSSIDSGLDTQSSKFSVNLLNPGVVVIDGVRFIGATLWTDFNKGDSYALGMFKSYMNDARMIRNSSLQLVSSWDIYKRHASDLQFLESTLALPFKGKTVVVTHHLPSQKSCDEKYADTGVANYFFYSDLDDIIEQHQPDLWIHGHTHSSTDYMIGKTRVVCNPKGYTGRYTDVDGKSCVRNENQSFNPSLIVEI